MKILVPENGKSLSDVMREASYVHTQTVSEATWTCPHPLKKMPAVCVLNSGDEVVFTRVVYLGVNAVQVVNGAASIGTVIMN